MMNQNTCRLWRGASLPALTFLAALSVSPAASAEDWIVGAAAGVTGQDDYQIAGPVARRDDSDTGFRLFGGYQISSMQAIVASWVDLGMPEYSGTALGGFSDSLDAEGVDLSYVVGWAPGRQSRVSVFGSVGILNFDQDVTLTDSSGTFLFHDEGTSFSAGLGSEINLSADGMSPWSVHVDYQLFKDVGDRDNSGIELDRELLSVGVAYRFRRGAR